MKKRMPTDTTTALHHAYITGLIETGRLPTTEQVAARLALSTAEVEQGLQDLAAIHGVVLHPHVHTPWVIHPFSASPTATWVESGGRGWWATCMWCACGVATLVGGNATIHARLGGESEDIDVHIENGVVREQDVWVHFAVPPHASWDNVHHFCATVLPFRSPEEVAAWSERHGIEQGAVVPATQVMNLGREWYARHADADWRKWSIPQAAEIFRKVGLDGEFWALPRSEGSF
jgi:hypothetical protein